MDVDAMPRHRRFVFVFLVAAAVCCGASVVVTMLSAGYGLVWCVTFLDLLNAVGSGVICGLVGAVITVPAALSVRSSLAVSIILGGASLAAIVSGCIAYFACASLGC